MNPRVSLPKAFNLSCQAWDELFKLFDQTFDGITRLSAHLEPVLNTLNLEIDGAFFNTRVKCAQLFNKAAITWHSLICCDHAIKRALLCSSARESNNNHYLHTSVKCLKINRAIRKY